MSEHDQDAEVLDPPNEAEVQARAMGWVPKEDFRGDAKNWRPAEDWLERGRSVLPIVQQQNRKLTDQVTDLTKRLSATQQSLEEVVNHTRTADKRAYERAMRDLKTQQEEAVTNGDTRRVAAITEEIADLRAEAPRTPVPPEVKPPPAPEPTAPAVSQATQAWVNANPWFMANPEAQATAVGMNGALMQTRPDLDEGERLAEVSRRMRRVMPELFTNPRRNDPSGVTPSSAGGRPNPNARTFANLPQDTKDAYARFKRSMDGKGKPLTEQEWADNYDWDQ